MVNAMKIKSLLALFLLCSTNCFGESEIVYKTIAMESANQGLEGQIAVAQVIIERSNGSNKSLSAVCLARKQFSCWNDSKLARAWLDRHYDQKTRHGAVIALNEGFKRPSNGFTHYHALGVSPYWAKGHNGKHIGNHVFYKLK